MFGRKIDDEADAMKPIPKKSNKRSQRNKSKQEEGEVTEEKEEEEPASTESTQEDAVELAAEVAEINAKEIKAKENSDNEEFIDKGYSSAGPTASSVPPTPTPTEPIEKTKKGKKPVKTSPFESDMSSMRVPKDDPLRQTAVPPEIVFFGEPRNPPPGEAARDFKYHGSLLMWARHATVAPRTSEERLTTVFPRGRLHPDSPKYRLDPTNLSFEKILTAFSLVMDDVTATKAFVDANIDLVPSKLFLRVITAEKLSMQSKNDLETMDYLKDVRRRYILAHDQVFFPLNIEVQKAETRVMTYLARDELRNFASSWDEVEMSLHYTTLLAARMTWDQKVKNVLDEIKIRVKETVGYMQEGIQKDLMSREFRKPAITSEVYLNASLAIQFNMPELYSKIRPEIQLMHETFFMEDAEALRDFVTTDFCPRTKMSPELLKERLKIFEASLAGIQGAEYVTLRVRVQETYRKLCNEKELDEMDNWFFLYKDKGYQFETYEPNTIPNIIRYEQRIRDTGNAFDNFRVDVLKMDTVYSDSLSGKRPKGDKVGNWLERDSNYKIPPLESVEDRMLSFREAYIAQTELRKEAESRLTQMIGNRMAFQDKILYGGQFADRSIYPSYEGDDSKVVNFDGEE